MNLKIIPLILMAWLLTNCSNNDEAYFDSNDQIIIQNQKIYNEVYDVVESQYTSIYYQIKKNNNEKINEILDEIRRDHANSENYEVFINYLIKLAIISPVKLIELGTKQNILKKQLEDNYRIEWLDLFFKTTSKIYSDKHVFNQSIFDQKATPCYNSWKFNQELIIISTAVCIGTTAGWGTAACLAGGAAAEQRNVANYNDCITQTY